MAKDLTSGFDIALHVSAKAIERVFQSYYWIGGFPNYVTKSFMQGGKEHSCEIFFKEPKLQLVSDASFTNPVKLTFGYVVRISKYDWESEGSTSVVLDALPVTIPSGGQNLTALGVAFDSVGLGEFQFTAANYPEFETVIKPAILDSLIQAGKNVLLTPPSALSPEQLTWQSYVDDNGVRFLGVFVNLSPGTQTAPASQQSFNPGEQMRFAIPIENFNAFLNQSLADMGLGSFPATITFEGDTYDVDSLKVSLKNHYLQVEGEIDDVEFVAKGNLFATDTGLEAQITWLDVDLPWYLDIANAFSGGLITRAVEKAIPSAIGGVGNEAFAGLGVFSQNLPGVETLIEIHNHGFVTTSTQGLVISATVQPVFDAVPVTTPTYVKAHKYSKEFHRPGCLFGDKIKWQNAAWFIREASAIRAGYNGCNTCAPEFSHPAGRLVFGYRSSTPSFEQQPIEIKVVGKLMEPEIVDGVTVTDPPFAADAEFTAKPDANGIWQFTDYSSANLAITGKWRFRATLGNWTGECTMKVKPTASKFGYTNYVAFTVGNPIGQFGYGKMPEFPQ